MFRLPLAAAVLAAAVPAVAADLPPDLALVPGTAAGFAHVRLAAVWKLDAMAPYRRVVERAGQRALDALDTRFAPPASSVERVTAVLFVGERLQPSAALVVHLSAPADAARVRSAHLPDGVPKSAGGREYHASKERAIAVVGDRTLVVGEEADVRAVLAGTGSGVFAPALRAAAAGDRHAVAAVNVPALPVPPDAVEQLPQEYRPLARATVVSAAVTLGAETAVEVRATYPDAPSAATAERSLRKAADLARVFLNQQRQEAERELFRPAAKGDARPLAELPTAASLVAALGAINTADEWLAAPPIARRDADLVASATLPGWATPHLAAAAVSAGVLLPALHKTREAAARARSQNNLKQIGLALHRYHDVHGHLPPAAVCDKKGRKLLSWRVAILPYLEQQALYNQFKLDEPWDSEHNRRWSGVVVGTYADPRADAPPGHTFYKAFVGNGAVFDTVQGTKFAQVTDGLSNTLMVAAAGDPVPWAKPDDLDFDPRRPLPELARPFGGQLLALFGDGSVRAFPEAAVRRDGDRLLRLLVQRADGMAIDFDF
jgi:hypothetical protein